MSLVFAFCIAVFAIVLSGILFYMNKDGAAITIIIGDLLAFGGAFIYGHKNLKQEKK